MLRNDPALREFDEKKMTSDWANQVISLLRRDWRPVVDQYIYRDNKKYLLSIQSLTHVEKYFDDEEFKKNNTIKPLPILEKTRNIFIDKARKSGIKPWIKAVDPSSEQDREQDKFRLMERRNFESAVNSNRSKIGLPPFKMNADNYNGNIEEFDQLQLNEGEPSDIAFFFKTFYKLDYETNAQIIIDTALQQARAEENAPRFIMDILCCKHTCSQTYVSPNTGLIKHMYIQPDQAYVIWGNNRDASDAPAAGWQKQITVMELLDIMGNSFNFNEHWPFLINAINYGSNQTFDGFMRGGLTFNLNPPVLKEGEIDRREYRFLHWENSFNYKVSYGYIEWPQIYAHTEKRNIKTKQRFTVDFSYEVPKRGNFEKESWYAYKMLCSNYIATGATSQWLFGYGPVYHQIIEGQYDEYARGTICIIREEGLPMVDVTRIYVDLANYAYYKMLWAIHRSKPDVWDFSYESIREVAKKMIPQTEGTGTPQNAGAFASAVMELIKMFQEKLVMLHTYPIVDGRIVGGGGTPHTKIPGQLDALAPQLRELVLEWAESQILDKLGMAGIANATQPNPKEGLKLNQLYLTQSNAATGYISEMYQKTFEHAAKLILNYAQDIVKLKSTIPYKALQKMVGERVLRSVKTLDNICAHRYGIFVTSFDTLAQKEEIETHAQIALQSRTITYSQWLLIKQTDDPRLASMLFAYFEEKAIRQQQQQAMQLEQMKQQTILMQHQAALAEIQAKGQYDLQGHQIQAQATVAGKQLDYNAKVLTKQIQVNSEPDKQTLRAQTDKEVLREKHNLEQQNPLP